LKDIDGLRFEIIKKGMDLYSEETHILAHSTIKNSGQRQSLSKETYCELAELKVHVHDWKDKN
jgi:hypothetical protein